MNVLIVEDNAEDFMAVSKFFNLEEEENLPDKNKTYSLIRATNKEEALKLIADRTIDFSIAIIDISLDEEDLNNSDGIDVARKILKGKFPFPVIITTNHFDVKEYAVKAEKMELNLKYFVNKNSMRVNPFIFQKLIDDAIDNFGLDAIDIASYAFRQHRKIGIRTIDGVIKFHGRNEILCLTTLNGHQTRFMFTDGSEHASGHNLGFFGKMIKSNFYNFLRIDQSTIVNIEMMETLEGNTLYFANGTSIQITNVAKCRLKREHLMV